MTDEEVEYVSHLPETFLDALDFYERRLDKGYSLTDYISMNICRERRISQILTHDDHFKKEGLTILL